MSVKTKDPQQRCVYSIEPEILKPISEERPSREALESVKKAVWSTRLSLSLKPPNAEYSPTEDNPFYFPWRHRIVFSSKNPSVATLLHELAHGKLAAIGVGPFVESHGPLFCREFGKMWSVYTTKPFSVFKTRCKENGLQVASRMPRLKKAKWALVKEEKGTYATRPAQRAVQMGCNIEKIFEDVKAHHPMA